MFSKHDKYNKKKAVGDSNHYSFLTGSHSRECCNYILPILLFGHSYPYPPWGGSSPV